jgi:hypothetical protein
MRSSHQIDEVKTCKRRHVRLSPCPKFESTERTLIKFDIGVYTKSCRNNFICFVSVIYNMYVIWSCEFNLQIFIFRKRLMVSKFVRIIQYRPNYELHIFPWNVFRMMNIQQSTRPNNYVSSQWKYLWNRVIYWYEVWDVYSLEDSGFGLWRRVALR